MISSLPGHGPEGVEDPSNKTVILVVPCLLIWWFDLIVYFYYLGFEDSETLRPRVLTRRWQSVWGIQSENYHRGDAARRNGCHSL